MLELSGVEPAGEAGRGEFVLHGVGFPLGRTGSIELRGVVHRPGRVRVPLRLSLTGQVVDEAQMVFGFAGHERALALAPGRFEGRLTASFGASRRRVQGSLEGVSLRLRAGSAAGRRDALVAARQAVAWFASLGARELEVDTEAGGVRVGPVIPDSVAERLGLRSGDRLVQSGGLPVVEVMDLLPDAGRDPVIVQVERAGGALPFSVTLPRSMGVQSPARVPLELTGFALLIGLSVLLVWPLPPPLHVPCGPSSTPGAVGTSAVVCVVGLAAQWGTELSVVRGTSLTLLVLLAVLLVPKGDFRRPGPWLAVASRTSLAALGIAVAGMAAGTLRPALGGAATPAQAWPLLGEPAGWASVALTFEALRPSGGGEARASAAWCGARGVALASLVGLLSGGGSLGPYVDCPATLGWLLKSACLWGALEIVLPRRLPGWGLFALAACAPGMALAWSLWNPPPDLAAGLAGLSPWLFGGLVVRAAVTRMRARFWPRPVIDPRLVPFL